MKNQCTLCSKCSLFKGKIDVSEDLWVMYTIHYCVNETNRWKECKRYSYESIKGECPDFVMPNTLLSVDQIWQKAQKEYALAV